MKLAFIIGGILVLALDSSAAQQNGTAAATNNTVPTNTTVPTNNAVVTNTTAPTNNTAPQDDETAWKEFVAKYNKVYTDKEVEGAKKKAFLDNKLRIEEHNERYAKGEFLFSVEVNEFSDITPAETVIKLNGAMEMLPRRKGRTFDSSRSVVPPNFDWRRREIITPVRNQGSCESDWAIVAADSIQSHMMIRGSTTPPLSVQQILECAEGEGNLGCNGGWVSSAYKYIHENGGLQSEASYPSKNNSEHACTFNKTQVVANITNYVDLDEGDEEMLRTAVAVVGPVAVIVDSSQWTFQHYSDGIYYEPLCSSTVVDHALLVVGYGTKNGTDFWIAKNTFGTDWGRNGYIKIARNKNNHCGIAKLASYPVVTGNKKRRRRNIKTFNSKRGKTINEDDL